MTEHGPLGIPLGQEATDKGLTEAELESLLADES